MLEDPVIAWHIQLWKEIGASAAAALTASKIVCDDDDFLGATIMAFLFALLITPLAKSVVVLLWMSNSPESFEAVFGEAGLLNILVGGLFVGVVGLVFERGLFAVMGAMLWNAVGPFIVEALSGAFSGGSSGSGSTKSAQNDRMDRFLK